MHDHEFRDVVICPAGRGGSPVLQHLYPETCVIRFIAGSPVTVTAFLANARAAGSRILKTLIGYHDIRRASTKMHCPAILSPATCGQQRCVMGHSVYDPAFSERPAWNAGRKVGSKRALKSKQIWEIRFWFDRKRRLRDGTHSLRRTKASIIYKARAISARSKSCSGIPRSRTRSDISASM